MKFASEEEFVQWLKARIPRKTRGMRLGIGDDAALIAPTSGAEFMVTNDMSIEGIHFLPRMHPPEAVGHRALTRPLSDVAAMGGRPRFAFVGLALSRRASYEWVELFLSGFWRLARRFRVTMLGGDTAWGAAKTMVDVVVLGDCPSGKALLRSGARPGDQVYVAGELGESALGLRALRTGRKAPDAVQAHLYPEPQCALGRFLRDRSLASAAIDLSDGLSTDLCRLCEASQVGARIVAEAVPYPRLPDSLHNSRAQLLSFALNGGEDYRLLFTASPGNAAKLPASFHGIRLFKIGEITRSRARTLVDADGEEKPLAARGYDHFGKSR
ncbi:MAG: thiamine-phosphate kinase [Terriglobia bacterium]